MKTDFSIPKHKPNGIFHMHLAKSGSNKTGSQTLATKLLSVLREVFEQKSYSGVDAPPPGSQKRRIHKVRVCVVKRACTMGWR